MRTLTFPKHPVVPYQTPEKVPNSYQNGLYVALVSAYNNHHGIVLSPDDLYNTITCLWAKYVLINAEKFRDQIVKHDGQKTLELIVPQNIVWNSSVLTSHMRGFIRKIHEDQGEEHTGWMRNEFSTSTPQDSLVRMCSILSAMKKFYVYESHTLCWLPEITLLGEKADWEMLYTSISHMKTYDDEMVTWKQKLLSVIHYFVKCDEEDIDFWQQVLIPESGGSGTVPSYQGWVSVFNPFDEKGKWFDKQKWNLRTPLKYYNTPRSAILSLGVDFEIVCKDDGGEHIGTVKVKSEPAFLHSHEDRLCMDSSLTMVLERVVTPVPARTVNLNITIERDALGQVNIIHHDANNTDLTS